MQVQVAAVKEDWPLVEKLAPEPAESGDSWLETCAKALFLLAIRCIMQQRHVQEDLPEIVMRRYERASTIITLNRPLED